MTTDPIPTLALTEDEHNGRFVELNDGNRWYAQRPAKKWKSDMHWISPADEGTHEEYLEVLGVGGFDQVLDAIGNALGLKGLVAYHLTFIAVSNSVEGFVHHDTTMTEGGVYNVIIPLLLEEDVPPELIIEDDQDGRRGGFKYKVGMGALMGDDAKHGTRECDYRNMKNAQHGIKGEVGMRLAATVYIADIDELNAQSVADETLTQIFPLADPLWLLSQKGRHWVYNSTDHNKLVGDAGRKAFRFRDEYDDCHLRAENGLCESDVEGTREKCLKSCEVYIEEGPEFVEKVNGTHYNLCIQNRTGGEECRLYEDTDNAGDFVSPKLEPGEMFPFVWREDGEFTTEYAFQIGLPPELTTELLDYCNTLGITEKFRELVGDNPIEAKDEHSGQFFEMTDGNRWYAQRPAKKWTSNMHWISPADEQTHEEYLKVLARGNFDLVLDAIGRYLGLEGLTAYHLTFIGVSHSEKGYIHHDTHHTGASVYNVIIPLILDDDALPELEMTDGDDPTRKGSLKYQLGTASLMGDDAMHGTQACDYRDKKGMRMAATVYIADINSLNAEDIAKKTLTQIFPLPDTKWLKSQQGRHWGNDNDNSLVTDKGRAKFAFYNKLLDCADRAEKGLCESDTDYTRVMCLKSCNIYDSRLNTEESRAKSDEKHTIDSFFSSLEYDDSCFDHSEECEEVAKRGLCMTDPDGMIEMGCYRSCLHCLTPDSRELFSLGAEQLLIRRESDDEKLEEGEEEATPEQVTEVMAKTEEYFVNEVFAISDYNHVRLSCRNYDEKCSIWAAQGHCERSRGWMGKNCPAACKDCFMIDWNNRCPIDYDSNVFGPGDINAMFERMLAEAGQDVSSFSKENPPYGGTHQFGELTVVTSPYDDMMSILKDEDKEMVHEYTPVPWVVAIEGFLSDEECNRFIELGGDRYERSTEYASTMNLDGTFDSKESSGRTSTNTWCGEGCRDDPIIKKVIERMESLTGIPYANFEDLQLVRYEIGQRYEEHHDYSSSHEGTQYGPRILTVFFYLNDVEEGGGTQFDELDFVTEPKRGMALIWPSTTNEAPDVMDDWTWHEALPVTKGIKYGANTWIHLRDYQNVSDYC